MKIKKIMLGLLFLSGIVLFGCQKKEVNSDIVVTVANETEIADSTSKIKDPVEILVGAAASLKNVMTDIEKVYKEKYPNVSITFTFGSSGSLQQQIQEGANIDVFLSAAQKQMETLINDDLIEVESKKDIIENKIVLIVPSDSKLNITNFADIVYAKTIALGDPASVPVGQYAEEIFNFLNILDQVKEKATYGKDVTEVLTWVKTGNADAGLVYMSDAITENTVKIKAEAPEDSYSRAIYPAAVVKATKNSVASQNFVDFLVTAKAQDIFKKYGFLPIE
ncbi:MAG: molybdate transporter substrate-binding protein [Anaerocolumna sp.]|jgi:molybdate transport system substrate-binding protein|nr:molybdate transporter substrate-binding protein [Anaerocolumna sp.]